MVDKKNSSDEEAKRWAEIEARIDLINQRLFDLENKKREAKNVELRDVR